MITLVLRRLTALPLILLGVAALTFTLAKLSPFNPIDAYVGVERGVSQQTKDQIAHAWGLDQPAPQQFVSWLSHLLQGDFGYTRLVAGQPVADVLAARIGPSMLLVGSALALVLVGGLIAGTLAAMFRNSWFDALVRASGYFMTAAPSFWVALLLLYIFAVQWRVLPAGGTSDLRAETSAGLDLRYMLLPILTLALTQQSWFTLFVRNTLLEVMREDYIQFARAQGLREVVIMLRHALPNALIPFATLAGTHVSELIGGTILIETIFSWPGLGLLTERAAVSVDLPLLLAITLLGALFVVAGNLLSDLLYRVLDPRIREALV